MTEAIKINLNAGIEHNPDLDCWEVIASDKQGRIYTHNHQFQTSWAAAALLAKVLEKGTINLEHWHCRVPYGTEAWLEEGMEATLMDDEERFRKGM